MTTTDLAPRLGIEPDSVTEADPDDDYFLSVTSIQKVLGSDGLIWWSGDETADYAITNYDKLGAWIDTDGPDEAWARLRKARFILPEDCASAADLGSTVHKLIEAYGLEGAKPDLAAAEQAARNQIRKPKDATPRRVKGTAERAMVMLNHFDKWAQAFSPEYQATEVVVYKPPFYAGTCDAFFTLGQGADKTRFIVDYKTHKKDRTAAGKLTEPYPDQNAMQLAAYRYADFAAVWRPRRLEQDYSPRFYLLKPSERALAVPVPEVDHGLVLHITPARCQAYPMDCGEEALKAFMHTYMVARWVNETSKAVMGRPLVPPQEAVA